ncbi:MAG: DUF3307 domain-containing protein [Aliishimia sp.]
MSETITLGTAIGILVLLQLKHMLADFFMQTPIMLVDRARYVHVGRALHCLVHAVGSVLCFLLAGLPMGVLFLIVFAEWIIHFHIDYGKGRWSDMKNHTPNEAGFWRAFGVDQTLHQLTYVAMLWAAVWLT